MDNQSFRAAYGVLQKHADTLRTRTEPDIDDLLTLVSESLAAYEICKTRIDAVEQALAQALGQPGSADGGQGVGGEGE